MWNVFSQVIEMSIGNVGDAFDRDKVTFH